MVEPYAEKCAALGLSVWDAPTRRRLHALKHFTVPPYLYDTMYLCINTMYLLRITPDLILAQFDVPTTQEP